MCTFNSYNKYQKQLSTYIFTYIIREYCILLHMFILDVFKWMYFLVNINCIMLNRPKNN